MFNLYRDRINMLTILGESTPTGFEKINYFVIFCIESSFGIEKVMQTICPDPLDSCKQFHLLVWQWNSDVKEWDTKTIPFISLTWHIISSIQRRDAIPNHPDCYYTPTAYQSG